MRVLVTGGAGFIGSHVVDMLVQNGEDVVVYDSLDQQVHGQDADWPDYCNEKAAYIKGDVRDSALLRKSCVGVEAIIHLAAKVGVGQSAYDIADYVDANVVGTAKLFETIVSVCPDLQRLIVAGSMSTYGEGMYLRPGQGSVPGIVRSTKDLLNRRFEMYDSVSGEALQPVGTPEWKRRDCQSVYALTKRDQEDMTLLFGKQRNLSVCVPRFFNVYGPRQALGNPYTGVVAIFSNQIKAGDQPLIYEDGQQTRDFIHVFDIARSVLAMLYGGSMGILNVGTGVPTTILGLALKLLGLHDRCDLAPDVRGLYRSGDIRHCYAAIEKLEKEVFDWKPMTLDDGLPDLLAWTATQEARPEMSFQAHRELLREGMLQ